LGFSFAGDEVTRRLANASFRGFLQSNRGTADFWIVGSLDWWNFMPINSQIQKSTDPVMTAPPALQWFRSGEEVFPAMLEAIATAREAVRLEIYIYADGKIGREIRDALTAAAQRGVKVSVLVDALGSWLLPGAFFSALMAAGGTVRFFNPLRPWRIGVRDHRKLLVCDDNMAFVGGFNIADEYAGDGVTCGWCDVGLRIENTAVVRELAASFDELFSIAPFRHRPILRLRAFKRRRKSRVLPVTMPLGNQPGTEASPLRIALHHDLSRARDVRIISAYFLPTRKLRRDLLRVARGGGRVQLILAGKSDVPLSQLAARSMYRQLLAAGVEIYEYQPQILHTKLVIADGIAYAGSANFDVRSLKLNYELMLRFSDPIIAASAREIFDAALPHCRKITLEEWRAGQTFWQRWRQDWARFLLARLDVFFALQQFRALAKSRKSTEPATGK
jgi:cardiolipin synthase A/B